MDEDTKKKTEQKLAATTSKLLHPDKWTDFSSVQLSPDYLFDSVMTLISFQSALQLAKLGKPVDRSDWLMSPQTVNAYYFPPNNEIVLPAGILQTPFYNASYPAWYNFATMSMVIGHEITHGFDNSGRWFDANGTLRDWWPKNIVEVFKQRAQCVVDYYDKYQVVNGVYVEGNVTEGENIADLGGMRLAHAGYKTHLQQNGEMYSSAEIAEYFPGFTPDQLFFISFGQLWCDASGDFYAQFLARSNEHSPAKFRVLGAVSNYEEFAQAFHCPKGTPMNPLQQCRVW
jgi:endothelin-converting enzyme/putative endopeptidase